MIMPSTSSLPLPGKRARKVSPGEVRRVLGFLAGLSPEQWNGVLGAMERQESFVRLRPAEVARVLGIDRVTLYRRLDGDFYVPRPGVRFPLRRIKESHRAVFFRSDEVEAIKEGVCHDRG